MIVEFIGCDGAGKTTLCRLLRACGIDGTPVVALPDLVLDRSVLRHVTHPTAANLVQDVCGLPFFVSALPRRREFVALAARTLARHAPSTFDRLNEMRGVVRTVGMFELARHRARDRIVLSDEGTVLTTYFFALGEGAGVDRGELERFARLVPRPDRLVYVRAPVSALVERALSRPDRRRHHAGKERAQIERRVRRTTEVFELVAATSELRERVIVVENDDSDETRRRQLVEELAGTLARAWETSRPTTSAQPRPRPAGVRSDVGS